MDAVTDLERICNPLFLAICNYWQLACINNPVELNDFREKILIILENTRARTMQDETLHKEFTRIEKPLIFFIDYVVREGRFPFRNEWHILARKYNELSGDEKFFDLLEESLQDPDAKNLSALFFLMIGLGFDGMYRRNQNHIQRYLDLCSQNIETDFDIFSKSIMPETKKRSGFFARRRRPGVWSALIAAGLFMAACFTFNLTTFIRSTADYRSLLAKAASDSIPTAVSARPIPQPPVLVEPIENVSVFSGESDSVPAIPVEPIENVSVFSGESDSVPAVPVEPIENVSVLAGEYELVYPEGDDSSAPGENVPVNGESLE